MPFTGKRKFKTILDGTVYEGLYRVLNGIIEVEYDGEVKSIELGGHDPMVVADILMAEIIKIQ